MKGLLLHRCKRGGAPTRVRLFWQLLATFAILIAFAVGGTTTLNSLTFRQITGRNLERSVEQLQTVLAEPLADYYVAHAQSWDGVQDWLDALLQIESAAPGAFASYIIVDAGGQIVAEGGPHSLDPVALSTSTGTPIMVDAARVGTFVLLPVAGPSDPRRAFAPERGTFFSHSLRLPTPPAKKVPASAPQLPVAPAPPWEVERQIGRSFMFVALGIGILTLGLAVIISRRISTPLARLTAAARQVAAGDLRVEVPGSSIQEVDTLARAFNRMASNLLHSDQLRRNMTADIAHELRTPLTIIKGKLEGILDGIYPGTPQHIAPVLEEANLLERLIDDLRLLSLAESGQLPLHREEVEVRDLLETVRAGFAAEAVRQDVQLKVDVPRDLPVVDVDAQRMQQVLGNLVANSLRHTPRGGQVQLSAVAVDHLVRILVHDSGTGIDPEELPHIFDRFWRGDRARSHTGSGAGLGLAIARQLVEAHGGHISAASEPGRGTLLTIALPALS